MEESKMAAIYKSNKEVSELNPRLPQVLVESGHNIRVTDAGIEIVNGFGYVVYIAEFDTCRRMVHLFVQPQDVIENFDHDDEDNWMYEEDEEFNTINPHIFTDFSPIFFDNSPEFEQECRTKFLIP